MNSELKIAKLRCILLQGLISGLVYGFLFTGMIRKRSKRRYRSHIGNGRKLLLKN